MNESLREWGGLRRGSKVVKNQSAFLAVIRFGSERQVGVEGDTTYLPIYLA